MKGPGAEAGARVGWAGRRLWWVIAERPSGDEDLDGDVVGQVAGTEA